MGCLKLHTLQEHYPHLEAIRESDAIKANVVQMWLSVDPLADDYSSHSPYNYCLNNPIVLFDPDGESPWRVAIAAARYIKRAYKIYKKTGKLTPKSLRKAGLDELVDIAGDLYTIFSGSASTLDYISAGVDLLIGTDFNNKGRKAAQKALGLADDAKDVKKAGKASTKNERKINKKRESVWKQKEVAARKEMDKARKDGTTKKDKAEIQKRIDHAVNQQKKSEPHAKGQRR